MGQFGIAYLLFPLALEASGVRAWQIGAVGGSFGVGNLIGLLVAPRTIARLGQRSTIVVGLWLSAAAIAASPLVPLDCWMVTSAACGAGLGLRCMGNETWLFSIIGESARGRLVGIHEALIAMATVVGPALIALLGATGWPPFAAAALFTVAALLPLTWAGADATPGATPDATPDARTGAAPAPPALAPARSWAGWIASLGLGAVVAGAGGLVEGALLSLFPVHAAQRGFDPAEAAGWLTVLGIGAIAMQWPLGWLADRRGMRAAAVIDASLLVVCSLALNVVGTSSVAYSILMFLLGGAVSGCLTLGIVAATSRSDATSLATRLRRVSVVFTVFAALGPFIAGAATSLAGADSLMIFIALVALVLLAVAARRGRDPATDRDRRATAA
jgi:MFS family permease